LRTPRDIWLETLKAFIDVDLSTPREQWSKWLVEKAVLEHAQKYFKKQYDALVCICTPEDAEDEFVLTQNAYASEAQMVSCTENQSFLFSFFPISSRLVIVSASPTIEELQDKSSVPRKQHSKSQGHSSTQLKMQLHNCEFCRLRAQLVRLTVCTSCPSTIETSRMFHRLSNEFVQSINMLFIDTAIFTDAIVYKSISGIRRSLEAYLQENTVPLLKVALVLDKICGFTDDVDIGNFAAVPEIYRSAYLSMLHGVARELGSDCRIHINWKPFSSITGLHELPAQFGERYRKLGRSAVNGGAWYTDTSGFDGSVNTFIQDERHARKWAWYSLYAFSTAPPDSKLGEKVRLLSKIARERPQVVWLYFRILRRYFNYSAVGSNEISKNYPQLVADDNAGWEDKVVDCKCRSLNYPLCVPTDRIYIGISAFAPEKVARMMLRAFFMQQWVSRTPNPNTIEYYTAAGEIVGNIRDCGIPILEAEIRQFESMDEAMTAERCLLRFPSQYKAHELEHAEMRLRYYLRDWLDMAQPLGDILLAGNSAVVLDELVFGILYPINVVTERMPSPRPIPMRLAIPIERQ